MGRAHIGAEVENVRLCIQVPAGAGQFGGQFFGVYDDEGGAFGRSLLHDEVPHFFYSPVIGGFPFTDNLALTELAKLIEVSLAVRNNRCFDEMSMRSVFRGSFRRSSRTADGAAVADAGEKIQRMFKKP